jgi:hypothetical protein
MTSSDKVSILFAGQELILEYGFASAISKDFNRLDDGTIVSEKHSITIRGAFTAIGNTPEDRYEDLLQKAVEYADFKGSQLVDRLVSLQSGPLQIYKMTLINGNYQTVGQPLISYNFAQLMSVSVGEPPEDTAGIHYQEVTFNFESITPPTDNIATKYRLKTASEQFEVKKEEDKMSYFVMGTDANGIIRYLADDPYYSYSITHTLSAQGQTMFYNQSATDYNTTLGYITPSPAPSPSNFQTNQKYEAFYEAYKYVNDKKKDSLINVMINLDPLGRPFVGSNAFYPVGWDVSNSVSGTAASTINGWNGTTNSLGERVGASGMVSNLFWDSVSGQQHAAGMHGSGKYGEYNVIRSSNIDIIGGSYSITTNYFYSRNPATIEINGSFEKGEDGDDIVRVEGTIQGLDSLGVNSDKQNKFKNAQILFKKLISSGVIDQSTSNPTIQSTATDRINDPESYSSVQPIYPSSIYGFGSGNVITNQLTGILKDPGKEVSTSAYSTTNIIKPWAYGTIVYAFADEIFRNNQYASYYAVDNVLDWKPVTTSITENKIAGSIQFSATYKGIAETVRSLRSSFGALSVSVNQSQENFVTAGSSNPTIYRTKHVIPVMILGRDKGPIIQDMNTTKESKRTIQIEAIYGAEHRHPNSPVVSNALEAAMKFVPSGTFNAGLKTQTYLTELSYSWDWPAGKLLITAGWIFTKP